MVAILFGAGKGKFDSKGNAVVMAGQSIPMATLGVWILWLGWFGFNGASQLALGSYADANVAVASIFTLLRWPYEELLLHYFE